MKAYITMDNRCIYCNNIIPEGEIICKQCFENYISETDVKEKNKNKEAKKEVIDLVNSLFKKLNSKNIKHLNTCKIEIIFTNKKNQIRSLTGEENLYE